MNQIEQWMKRNVNRFVEHGEVNCTKMVESWDSECSSGEATLDSSHVAWDIALNVADWYEGVPKASKAPLLRGPKDETKWA